MRVYFRTGRRSGVSVGPFALVVLLLLAASAVFAYALIALAFLLVAGGGYALVAWLHDRRRKDEDD